MKQPTYRLTLTALFVALMLLLGLTPIGMIPLGFIHVTVITVPITIGTILLGLKTGLLLGGLFGLTSFLTALGLGMTGPSALVAPIVAASPFYALVLSFLPRLLIPVTAHFVYQLSARGQAQCVRAVPLAALSASLTNTVFYLGTMLLLYIAIGLDQAPLIGVLTGSGLLIGGCEAACASLLATPILSALFKVSRKFN